MNRTAENRLENRLRDGEALLGLYHGYAHEGILETIGGGWDFVWIDGQHGQFSFDGALRAVRTASLLGLETVLRVPTHDPGLLGQYADTAASALMIPQVDSPDLAKKVVRALRFPPRGNRSFGGRRPVDMHGRDYYRHHEPLIIAQIESQLAVENLNDITAIDGVDALFFGAADFKLSLGLPIDAPVDESESVRSAQYATASAARATGKWCGCGVVAPCDVPALLEMGYQLLAIGGDVAFLRTGARDALDEGRRALAQRPLRAVEG